MENKKHYRPYPSDTLYINEKVNTLGKTLQQVNSTVGKCALSVLLLGGCVYILWDRVNKLDRRLDELEIEADESKWDEKVKETEETEKQED